MTFNEILVTKPVPKVILKSYDEYDDFEEVHEVLSYTVDEIVTEKICALIDPKRSEPRDLYDIWHLFNEQEISRAFLPAYVIKKKNKKFSLTKKGHEILTMGNNKQLFEEIILTWTKNFNWGFSDGYSDLDLIQRSAIFNFYMLNKLCNDWSEDKEIGLSYLNAFPNLVLEARNSYSGPEREIINCFSVRFLERFCLPLGLLEQKEEGDNYTNRKVFYRITPFFKDNFKFVVSDS